MEDSKILEVLRHYSKGGKIHRISCGASEWISLQENFTIRSNGGALSSTGFILQEILHGEYEIYVEKRQFLKTRHEVIEALKAGKIVARYYVDTGNEWVRYRLEDLDITSKSSHDKSYINTNIQTAKMLESFLPNIFAVVEEE